MSEVIHVVNFFLFCLIYIKGTVFLLKGRKFICKKKRFWFNHGHKISYIKLICGSGQSTLTFFKVDYTFKNSVHFELWQVNLSFKRCENCKTRTWSNSIFFQAIKNSHASKNSSWDWCLPEATNLESSKQDKKVHAISFCFNITPCCFTMLCHNHR